METELEELDLFQIHVTEGLSSLLNLSSDDRYSLLTIDFLISLLDVYLRLDEEFKGLLPLVQSQNPAAGAGAVSVLAKPPLDRIITDYLDRSIKSLDICTAVTNSLDMLSYSNRDADIAVAVIRGKSPNKAQFNRAKNATLKLLSVISPLRSSSPKRAWSFGRTGSQDDLTGDSLKYPQRTLSLTLSKNWSATKQLATMEANLYPPRGGEESALNLAFYTMSSVQVLVMWLLVASFPSLERCPVPGFPLPPQKLLWSGPMWEIHERITDEWKKERRGAANVMPSAMLAEVHGLEKYGKRLMELGDSTAVFPVEGDLAEEMEKEAKEMERISRVIEEEVEKLQKRISDVFRAIIRCRAYVIDLKSQNTPPSRFV